MITVEFLAEKQTVQQENRVKEANQLNIKFGYLQPTFEKKVIIGKHWHFSWVINQLQVFHQEIKQIAILKPPETERCVFMSEVFLQRSPVKSLSLSCCVIVAELCRPCLVPQCRTNVLQINSSSKAGPRWSLHTSSSNTHCALSPLVATGWVSLHTSPL